MPNYTVLLIDYEPKSIDRIRRPLMGIGYKVEVATDGISGIEAFHRMKPDLVMIEAMIPKKHGFEVCQEIKKTQHGKRTPVIITTSVYKGRKYRNQAFHLHGCDEYIEKPIDEEQIVVVCRRMLGDNSAPSDGTGESAAQAGAPPVAAASSDESFTPTPEVTGPPPEFPPLPPAPAGMDDDELEIMAKLDSILFTGGAPSRPVPTPAPTPAPAAAPMPPPAPAFMGSSAPRAAANEMFATAFLPSTDSTPNQDLAPRALEEEVESNHSVATALEPMPFTSIGEPPPSSMSFPRPVEPAAESAAELAEETSQGNNGSDSRRSKKKDRRKKSPPPPVVPAMIPGPPAATPTLSSAPAPQAQASVSMLAVPKPPEPALSIASEPVVKGDPFDSSLDEESGRPWWLSVAVALVLIGVAGALLFLYLGN